jgi:predicted membrane protein
MTVGVVLLALGVAELVTHLDEPLSLFFWLPALWGGGALVLVGVFRTTVRPWLSEVLVIIGAFLGLLATAWTVLVPVLMLTLVVLTIVHTRRKAPPPA